MRSNISLYKSTFDFFHIYVFLKPEQTGADEGIYFFSTDKLFNYGISESELHSIGSSSLWLLKKNTTLPRVISASKRSANTLLCFRALQDKSSNVLEYAYCIALDCDEFSRYLQTSASDTAISSYILTPQGQIAAHSDSSRNQTWISDSIRCFWKIPIPSLKTMTSTITAALWITVGCILRKSRKTISKAIHRYLSLIHI